MHDEEHRPDKGGSEENVDDKLVKEDDERRRHRQRLRSRAKRLPTNLNRRSTHARNVMMSHICPDKHQSRERRHQRVPRRQDRRQAQIVVSKVSRILPSSRRRFPGAHRARKPHRRERPPIPRSRERPSDRAHQSLRRVFEFFRRIQHVVSVRFILSNGCCRSVSTDVSAAHPPRFRRPSRCPSSISNLTIRITRVVVVVVVVVVAVRVRVGVSRRACITFASCMQCTKVRLNQRHCSSPCASNHSSVQLDAFVPRLNRTTRRDGEQSETGQHDEWGGCVGDEPERACDARRMRDEERVKRVNALNLI